MREKEGDQQHFLRRKLSKDEEREREKEVHFSKRRNRKRERGGERERERERERTVCGRFLSARHPDTSPRAAAPLNLRRRHAWDGAGVAETSPLALSAEGDCKKKKPPTGSQATPRPRGGGSARDAAHGEARPWREARDRGGWSPSEAPLTRAQRRSPEGWPGLA